MRTGVNLETRDPHWRSEYSTDPADRTYGEFWQSLGCFLSGLLHEFIFFFLCCTGRLRQSLEIHILTTWCARKTWRLINELSVTVRSMSRQLLG